MGGGSCTFLYLRLRVRVGEGEVAYTGECPLRVLHMPTDAMKLWDQPAGIPLSLPGTPGYLACRLAMGRLVL